MPGFNRIIPSQIVPHSVILNNPTVKYILGLITGTVLEADKIGKMLIIPKLISQTYPVVNHCVASFPPSMTMGAW